MFNSLKKQNRIHGPTRRTISCKPIRSGRGESSIAASDEADILALHNAKKKGLPFYFIRTGCGSTLDVVNDRAVALRARDEMRDRIHNGRPNIHAYERIGNGMTRLPG